MVPTNFQLLRDRLGRRLRAARKARELSPVADRTARIAGGDILLFATLRNERIRLAWFLDYYRALGVGHFLFVDNASDDGTREQLAAEPDVSLWTTAASYKRARFGMDWINHLLGRFGHGHWTLTVDVDEFLVYPYCDTRPLRALTDWLDASSIRALPAMLIDTYPRGPIDAEAYTEGRDPLEIAAWFDPGNYVIERNDLFQNLWIQGGPRARMFFPDTPAHAPALNKIPLVKWRRGQVFVSSTHMLLPRGLNRVYDEWGGEKAAGALMHAKFLDTFTHKAREEMQRRQHYAASREYAVYEERLRATRDLWCAGSARYSGWRQLEEMGLISPGSWA